MNVGVVILGAGASTRMGQPKLLLPWGGTTVIGHLLTKWSQSSVTQIAVVTAQNNQFLHEELDRLKFPQANRIFNPAPERGMFSSIQCAAGWPGWQPNLTHWAMALGDQPHVRADTLRRVIDLAARHPTRVCQPARAGRGRHPVLLPASVFVRLPQARDESLKQFLLNSGETPVREEMDDAGLDLDIDEPADYERALQLVTAPV